MSDKYKIIYYKENKGPYIVIEHTKKGLTDRIIERLFHGVKRISIEVIDNCELDADV